MRLRSLRARLLAGVAVLVACGLTAGAVVTYAEQRSFLLDRVDQQVQSAVGPLSFQLGLDGRRAAVNGARPRSPGPALRCARARGTRPGSPRCSRPERSARCSAPAAS